MIMNILHKQILFEKEKTVTGFISSRYISRFVNAEFFRNILNTLVIATIVIFAVCLGYSGYACLKGRLAVRK